jgi:type VI protein secretion system component VasK
VADAYNALKTYLMLGDKTHAEPGHLNDQLTRFWRGWLEANRGAMPREQMIRSAERMITFHLSQVADPAWPQVTLKLACSTAPATTCAAWCAARRRASASTPTSRRAPRRASRR